MCSLSVNLCFLCRVPESGERCSHLPLLRSTQASPQGYPANSFYPCPNTRSLASCIAAVFGVLCAISAALMLPPSAPMPLPLLYGGIVPSLVPPVCCPAPARHVCVCTLGLALPSQAVLRRPTCVCDLWWRLWNSILHAFQVHIGARISDFSACC